MAVQGYELFQSPSGQLFIVKRAATHGQYAVYGVIPNYLQRFTHKHAAIRSINSGHLDPPPKDL